jgi:hypothetical protein
MREFLDNFHEHRTYRIQTMSQTQQDADPRSGLPTMIAVSSGKGGVG